MRRPSFSQVNFLLLFFASFCEAMRQEQPTNLSEHIIQMVDEETKSKGAKWNLVDDIVTENGEKHMMGEEVAEAIYGDIVHDEVESQIGAGHFADPNMPTFPASPSIVFSPDAKGKGKEVVKGKGKAPQSAPTILLHPSPAFDAGHLIGNKFAASSSNVFHPDVKGKKVKGKTPTISHTSPTYAVESEDDDNFDGHSDSSGEIPWANKNGGIGSDGAGPSSRFHPKMSPSQFRHESPHPQVGSSQKIVRSESFPMPNMPTKLTRQLQSKIGWEERRRHSKSDGADIDGDDDINWNKNAMLLESEPKSTLSQQFGNNSKMGGGSIREIVTLPNSPESAHHSQPFEGKISENSSHQNSPKSIQKSPNLHSKAKQFPTNCCGGLGKKKAVKMAKKFCNGLLTCLMGPGNYEKKRRENVAAKGQQKTNQ